MLMFSKNTLIVILVLICVLLGLALLTKGTNTPPPATEPMPPAAPSPPLTLDPEGEAVVPVRQSISAEMVEKLYLGQTYEAVETLWGISADDHESEYERGIEGYTSPHTTVWYTWDNPDKTRVRLGFIDGKLERKEFHRFDGQVISNEIDLKDLK